jgi:hypothetical protein
LENTPLEFSVKTRMVQTCNIIKNMNSLVTFILVSAGAPQLGQFVWKLSTSSMRLRLSSVTGCCFLSKVGLPELLVDAESTRGSATIPVASEATEAAFSVSASSSSSTSPSCVAIKRFLVNTYCYLTSFFI